LASLSFQVPRLGFCAVQIVKPAKSITAVNAILLAFMLPPGCETDYPQAGSAF
jgi:hypothetical protein